VTAFLTANVTEWWMLLPLRVVEGAAAGAYHVGNLAMMGDILEGHPHRARMIGAYRMSGSLAFAVAIVIAGLVAQTWGFHTTYTVASGIYAASFLLSLTLPEARSCSS
jgi:MFS family permease